MTPARSGVKRESGKIVRGDYTDYTPERTLPTRFFRLTLLFRRSLATDYLKTRIKSIVLLVPHRIGIARGSFRFTTRDVKTQ